MHNIFLIRRRFGTEKGSFIVGVSLAFSLALLVIGIGVMVYMS